MWPGEFHRSCGLHSGFHFFTPPDVSARDVGIAEFCGVDEGDKEHREVTDSGDKS